MFVLLPLFVKPKMTGTVLLFETFGVFYFYQGVVYGKVVVSDTYIDSTEQNGD